MKELKTRCFVSIGGAPEVPWEALTPEQQEDAGRQMALNMKKALEQYYGAHPEAWDALSD